MFTMSSSLSSSADQPPAIPLVEAGRWSEKLLYRNLLFVVFLLLGLWYSLATPPFETPDELYHYAFVRHIAQGHWLPVQQAEVDAPWEQEGSQAPLYYLLVGWLTRGIDQSDFAAISVRNPRANIGDPLFPGNKNFMLYSAVPHPLRGANLALHIGRWVSLLFGLITLWSTYATAQLVYGTVRGEVGRSVRSVNEKNGPGLPRHALYPLVITLWVAAIPQFAFISASCSNDSLITAVAAITIYWLARLLVKPVDAPIAMREWLILGVLLGVAALSKLQGLGLVGVAGLVVLWLAWQRRNWWVVVWAMLPVGIPLVGLAGWWYWRNFTLYGDFLGTGHLLTNNGLRTDALTWNGLWGELRGLRYSFWGLFGWFNLLLPNWLYALFDGVTVVALLGLLVRPLWGPNDDRRIRIVRLLAVLWTLLSLLLLAYWISQATGSQGRLLFPAIGVIIYLLVDGLRTWVRWLPAKLQSLFWLTIPLLLVGASCYTLLVLYPRVYGVLQPVARLPENLPIVDMHYRGIDRPTDELRVLALELPTARYRPGERVPITLYLQADQPVVEDYQLFIQLLNEEGTEIGNLTSHPGWGRFPTTLWQPGAIYADRYPVLIERAIDNRSPLLARVYVGFVNPATEERGRFPIAAYDGAGHEVSEPFLGTVAVSPSTAPEVADYGAPTMEPLNLGSQFGTVIQLSTVLLPDAATFAAAVRNSAPLTVTLFWDAIGTPAADYTAFLHFIDRDGGQATGFDQAPSLRFPTSNWRSGDRIVTTFIVPPPVAGELDDFAIWVGLYEAESGGAVRLPVTDAAGQVAGDGQVLVRDRASQ